MGRDFCFVRHRISGLNAEPGVGRHPPSICWENTWGRGQDLGLGAPSSFAQDDPLPSMTGMTGEGSSNDTTCCDGSGRQKREKGLSEKLFVLNKILGLG